MFSLKSAVCDPYDCLNPIFLSVMLFQLLCNQFLRILFIIKSLRVKEKHQITHDNYLARNFVPNGDKIHALLNNTTFIVDEMSICNLFLRVLCIINRLRVKERGLEINNALQLERDVFLVEIKCVCYNTYSYNANTVVDKMTILQRISKKQM